LDWLATLLALWVVGVLPQFCTFAEAAQPSSLDNVYKEEEANASLFAVWVDIKH